MRKEKQRKAGSEWRLRSTQYQVSVLCTRYSVLDCVAPSPAKSWSAFPVFRPHIFPISNHALRVQSLQRGFHGKDGLLYVINGVRCCGHATQPGQIDTVQEHGAAKGMRQLGVFRLLQPL